MIDCPMGTDSMAADGLQGDIPVRAMLCVLSAGHKCQCTKDSNEWLENWVMNNWWVVATVGESIGLSALASNEIEVALSDTDFKEVIRSVLSIAFATGQALTLGQLIILLVHWWAGDTHTLLGMGPHIAAYRHWVISLDVNVTTAVGRINLTTQDVTAVIRTSTAQLAEIVPVDVLEGNFRVSSATHVLSQSLTMARGHCGLTTALMPTTRGWQEYPWMTAAQAARGSGSLTQQESKDFRATAGGT